MNERELLLSLCSDLAEKIAERSEFRLLQSAAILRQLLFDNRGLINHANAELKIKIRYPMICAQPPPFPCWALLHMSTRPYRQDDGRIKLARLHEFTSYKCLYGPQDSFSVHAVVQLCANVRGGVHYGTPDTAKQQDVLDEISRVVTIGNVDLALSAIVDISEVVLDGVKPLLLAIESK